MYFNDKYLMQIVGAMVVEILKVINV